MLYGLHIIHGRFQAERTDLSRERECGLESLQSVASGPPQRERRPRDQCAPALLSVRSAVGQPATWPCFSVSRAELGSRTFVRVDDGGVKVREWGSCWRVSESGIQRSFGLRGV